MSKKHKNILQKIQIFTLVTAILLAAYTYFYNQNYSTLTLTSKFKIEMREKNVATKMLMSNYDVDFNSIAEQADFDEIIAKFDLLDFTIKNSSIYYTINQETKKKKKDSNEVLFDIDKKEKKVNNEILRKINEQIDIFSKDILENVYTNIFYLNEFISHSDIIYDRLEEADKLDFLRLKLNYAQKFSYTDQNKFNKADNIDDFLAMYDIKFKIINSKKNTFEKNSSISYIDLLIVIITLFVIYASLHLFITKIKKN